MSTSAEHGDKSAAGAGAAAGLQAPKLRTGGYAAWRADMEVYLARIGAGGAHKRAMEKDHWLALVLQVEAWSDDAVAAALAHLGLGASAASSSGSSSSSTSSATALTDREEATRKTIRLLVEQSTKAYGAIWSALSEDLRAQASKGGEVPLNFAHGLWAWLEKKFQSTETDSIGDLLATWIAQRQDEEESFDAYRARVNHLRALLAHAKEPQSDNMYAYMLLDRLQPRYTQAVLALKAGGQLKDATKIEWDSVTAFINAHERNEQRQSGGATTAAMANAIRGSGAGSATAEKPSQQDNGGASWTSQRGGHGGSRRGGQQQRGGQPQRDRRTCFRCDQKGHIAATCPNPPKKETKPAGEQASAVVRAKARPESRNSFEALSSDDEDDREQKDSNVWPLLGSSAKTPDAPVPTVSPQAATGQQHAKSVSTWANKVMQTSHGGKAVTPTPAVAQVRTAPPMQLDVALANHAWGWDTMASSCCSGNRARFLTLRKCPVIPVKVAEGSIVEAAHIGSVALRVRLDTGRVVRIVIDDVLYHPRFSSNLLSGELLTKKLGWQYHSTPECTYVVTPGGDRATLSRRGRVSVLMCAEPELQRANSATALSAALSAADAAGVDQLVLLHQRLNHMGWTRMMATMRSGAVDDLGVRLDALTKTCIAQRRSTCATAPRASRGAPLAPPSVIVVSIAAASPRSVCTWTRTKCRCLTRTVAPSWSTDWRSSACTPTTCGTAASHRRTKSLLRWWTW
jgi:hypothetical protein